ncbi:MAG: recombination regulator RecX [Lentisphaeria bacterium]|nr:recombination regulator RecX [Lentisphaeria bacterium]
MSGTPIPALHKAMNLLAARPLSEIELLNRLRRAGYSDPEADAAIAECRKRRYLDDNQLTQDGVTALRERNLGGRQIRLRLQRRGLDPEQIQAQLEQDPEAEFSAAVRAKATKERLLKTEPDPRKKREKLFRFLAGRGFSSEVIFRVLDTAPPGESAGFTDEYQ